MKNRKRLDHSVVRRIRRVYVPIGAVIAAGWVVTSISVAVADHWVHRGDYVWPFYVAGWLLLLVVLLDICWSEIRKNTKK